MADRFHHGGKMSVTDPGYALDRRTAELRDTVLEAVHQWKHRHPTRSMADATTALRAALRYIVTADCEGGGYDDIA